MIQFILFLLVLSLIVALFLLIQLWKMRKAAGALELFLLNVASGIWSFGYIFEIIVSDFQIKLFWAKFQYFGIAFVTVWLLLFMIRYTSQAEWFGRKYTALLLLIPLFTIFFTFTNETHQWMWSQTSLQTGWLIAPLALEHGWWFWVEIVYSYLLLAAATILLIRFVVHSQKIYKTQSVMMLAALAAPWLGNALYILGVRPAPNLDLTPIFFTITNIGLAVGFLRFRLLDLLPVAHSSIFKFMDDGVIVLDTKERVIDINPAARGFFNQYALYSTTHQNINRSPVTDPFISHKINEIIPEWLNLQEVSEGSEIKELQLWDEVNKDKLYYSYRSTQINNERGKITGRVLIFTDITNLKKSEEQMRLQATALETVKTAIVITNAAGSIEWVNPAFTTLTGYSIEEALGQNPRILKSGQHTDELYKDLWKTITNNMVWHGEIINKHKNGSFYYEEMTITPLINEKGDILHFIAIKQDISERKLAEEKLRKAHQQAIEANLLKTKLLANVSHDMRTPLGAIIGYSDMLAVGALGELTNKQEKMVEEIQDSANQLLLFVNNLIGQAQFETGKIILRNKLFSLSDLIETSLNAVNMIANKKGLQLVCEIDPVLPKDLYGDIYWLRQMVVNLLNNAVKFTDQGSVKLRLYEIENEQWAIEVSDTGNGIPREAQRTIFEPFLRGQQLSDQEKGGSGLGLAIVKELSDLMTGEIYLVSVPGAGSTFTVCLPIVREENL